MDGFTRCDDEMPPVGMQVEVAFSGRYIHDVWTGDHWALDPSGRVMYMWWRAIQD